MVDQARGPNVSSAKSMGMFLRTDPRRPMVAEEVPGIKASAITVESSGTKNKTVGKRLKTPVRDPVHGNPSKKKLLLPLQTL